MAGGDDPTKSIGDVLDAWSKAWNQPLETALPKEKRRLFAFSGSLPWVVYNITPGEWQSYLQSLETVIAACVLAGGILMQLAVACWFAWLIGYQNRRCSPTRFFLEGLLLPGLAAGLLTGLRILTGGTP